MPMQETEHMIANKIDWLTHNIEIPSKQAMVHCWKDNQQVNDFSTTIENFC